MKIRIAATTLAALLVCLLGTTDANKLLLVERGESLVPIVVFENAPPKTRRAADELAEYFEKVSGARPEIIEGRPDPIPEPAIWVGYQPILDELFPALDFDFQHPEEILIAASESHLVIAGRDIWDPDRLVVDGGTWMSGYPRSAIVGKQQEYGTVNAVYTFIQDRLDVRWLWPGDLGEDIVERDTIALAPFEHRHHPIFRERTLLRLSSLGDRRGRSHEWSRLQRLQLISLLVPGGHPFEDWWDRFSEDHPEYFALQPDGTRSGFPVPVDAKLCLSNPGVWAQWLADVEEQLAQNPARTVFDGSENDSSNRGICVCEHCRAWDALDAQPWNYAWEGLSQQYVAMTDRYMTFWNILAERLNERFPDRELYVSGMVYGPARPAPVNVELAPNTVLSYVGGFPLTNAQRRESQRAEWLERAAIAPKMRYRPNIFYVGGGIWGWPEVAMTKTVEDFRFLAENQCIGLWVDTAPEHWATQGPQYYLMTHLLWDPFLDADALLGDYYRRGFGPAAESIQRYWTLMEQANERFMSLPGLGMLTRDRHSRIPMARDHVYTPEFLEEAGDALRLAAQQAGAPVYRERVEFVRAGYDVLRLMMETVPLMERVRESDGGDAEAVEQAVANWEEMGAIADQAGPHAFRFGEIRSRMRGGYMGGVEDYLGPPAERYRAAADLVPGAEAEADDEAAAAEAPRQTSCWRPPRRPAGCPPSATTSTAANSATNGLSSRATGRSPRDSCAAAAR